MGIAPPQTVIISCGLTYFCPLYGEKDLGQVLCILIKTGFPGLSFVQPVLGELRPSAKHTIWSSNLTSDRN